MTRRAAWRRTILRARDSVGAGSMEWVGMAAAAGVVVLALVLAAPGWAHGLADSTSRVVCRIVGQVSCPTTPTPAAPPRRVEAGPSITAPAQDDASGGDGSLAVTTFAAKTGGATDKVDVTRHVEWRSRSDALSDFGFRDPERCQGRSVQSAYCFGPDGTLRYCRDETIHDELRRRLQSQEVFCDAALKDSVVTTTVAGDCGIAPNVQVDGTPTDEWICRFVLDAGGVVFARCTETLPGQRTCIDVEQDAYRTTDPKAVVCHSNEFSIARTGDTQTGLRVCSSPGGSVYACAFEDTVSGDLATDSPTPVRCDRRIFELDPEIACRLTERRQPTPNVLETRCTYGTTPIVCLEYTRQPGDLVHCATTPTTPPSTDPCTARLQVPATLANPGRHLGASTRVIDTTALIALFGFLAQRGAVVVDQLATCPSKQASPPPDSALARFRQVPILVQIVENGQAVAQIANGLIDPNLPPTAAQATFLHSAFEQLESHAFPAGAQVHVQFHQGFHGTLNAVNAHGTIALDLTESTGAAGTMTPPTLELIVQGLAFHASHPSVVVHLLPTTETPDGIPLVVSNHVLQLSTSTLSDTLLVQAVDHQATLIEQHPNLHPASLTIGGLLQAAEASPPADPIILFGDIAFVSPLGHDLELLLAGWHIDPGAVAEFVIAHDLGALIDHGEEQLATLMIEFVLKERSDLSRESVRRRVRRHLNL